MSIHKLTAGSGYDYLTRQVAAQDVTEKGHSSLASYYCGRKGERPPGTWIGAGMAGLARMAEGDEVTAEQMRNLFGAGKHPPLAEQLRAIASEQGLDANGQEAAASLGTPFRVYANDVSEFRRRLALEVTAFNTARGLPGDTWYQCKPAPTSVPKSPRPCSAKSSTATPPPMRASSLQRSPSTLGPPGPTLSRASTSRSPPP